MAPDSLTIPCTIGKLRPIVALFSTSQHCIPTNTFIQWIAYRKIKGHNSLIAATLLKYFENISLSSSSNHYFKFIQANQKDLKDLTIEPQLLNLFGFLKINNEKLTIKYPAELKIAYLLEILAKTMLNKQLNEYEALSALAEAMNISVSIYSKYGSFNKESYATKQAGCRIGFQEGEYAGEYYLLYSVDEASSVLSQVYSPQIIHDYEKDYPFINEIECKYGAIELKVLESFLNKN